MVLIVPSDSLYHHGIKGQEWGKRNGPPYPLKGEDLSPSEKKHAPYKKTKKEYSKSNKKHYDITIQKDTVFQTMSRDPDRLKDTTMFYANFTNKDKLKFKGKAFNRPVDSTYGKWLLNTATNKDIKVASEDAAAEIFTELLKNDRDFSNFIKDPKRFAETVSPFYKRHKDYVKEVKRLQKIHNGVKMTEDDARSLYKLFNYTIPYDGRRINQNLDLAADAAKQKEKFFKMLKAKGYSAILDTNDALYGGIHATYPVIVFDMNAIVSKDAYQTTLKEMRQATRELHLLSMFPFLDK